MPRVPVIITEEDDLYRRFIYYHIKRDGKLSSAAFTDKKKQPLSVFLKRLTTIDHSLTPEERKNGFFGLAELPASIPLRLGLDVSHDPTPEHMAHCLIRRTEESENFSEKELGSRLAEACTIIVKPESRN